MIKTYQLTITGEESVFEPVQAWDKVISFQEYLRRLLHESMLDVGLEVESVEVEQQ